MLKVNENLKWNTIINRVNKHAGKEMFKIQNDVVYKLEAGELQGWAWVYCCSANIFNKKDFCIDHASDIYSGEQH